MAYSRIRQIPIYGFLCWKTGANLNNPTIVVITDRNDLDDQLFDTFAGNSDLLRQPPKQAESCEHLKNY